MSPRSAFIDEGTSRGYGARDDQVSLPPGGMLHVVRRSLADNSLSFKEGAVWTTDAVFRETPAKVERFRQQGALAVEMELSAWHDGGPPV